MAYLFSRLISVLICNNNIGVADLPELLIDASV
jgi:hypothetical protein